MVTSAPESVLRVVFWQPAVSLYAVLGALLLAVARARSRLPLLVWIPALSNTLVWLVLAENPGLRFQWPVVLLAPLLLCAATANWRDLPAARSLRRARAAPAPPCRELGRSSRSPSRWRRCSDGEQHTTAGAQQRADLPASPDTASSPRPSSAPGCSGCCDGACARGRRR